MSTPIKEQIEAKLREARIARDERAKNVIGMTRVLNSRTIIISADRLDDCKEYLGTDFHQLIDHALSVGWSIDEVIVALSGLAEEEIAVPERAVTLH